MLGLASHQLAPMATAMPARLQSWPSLAAWRPAVASPSPAKQAIHASACFLSICLAFLVYGVLQERVMTVGFGSERELFTSSLFVVFCNRLMTCFIAFLTALMQPGGVQPKAPLQSYAAVSFANLVASTCQYDSLKYVSFAMQTLAKCCKVLPVMAWGVLLRRKRYPATEVLTAACVVAGCAAFIFSGNVLSKAVSDSLTWQLYAIGCGLLLLYLAFDGFASTWQDRLFAGFEMDTSNQVLYTSLFSMLISLCVLLSTGEVWAVARFLLRHPPAAIYITAVSSVATIIQYFVAYTIKTYGALNFATIMTARQFLSVIASCIIFKHSFTPGQWAGTLIVFAALAMNVNHKRAKVAPSQVKVTSPAATDVPDAAEPASGKHDQVSDEMHIFAAVRPHLAPALTPIRTPSHAHRDPQRSAFSEAA